MLPYGIIWRLMTVCVVMTPLFVVVVVVDVNVNVDDNEDKNVW